jgi:integrase
MRAGGKDRIHKIGDYAPGAGGIGLAEARRIGLEVAKRYAIEGDTFKDQRVADALAAAEAKRTEEAVVEAAKADARGDGSLGALLLAYVSDLRSRGKVSADDTEKMLRRHVEAKHPKLWGKPARKVTREDLHVVLADMLDAGIGRRVNLMRSVISSAFQYGLTLADDSQHHQLAKVFQITANPAITIKRRGDLEKKGQRVLTTDEVGRYLNALDTQASGVMRTFLVAQIGLAGQRIEQLLRVKWTDYRDGVLTLVDAKGRGASRLHLVPVPKWIDELLQPLRALNSEYIFSTGVKPLHADSVTHAVQRICKVMKSEPFKAADIRRTCETQLAALKVSKDVRTELLSHGRSSLIAGRYDHHQYLDEKREALKKWGMALKKWRGQHS